jgi:hypothetical protein
LRQWDRGLAATMQRAVEDSKRHGCPRLQILRRQPRLLASLAIEFRIERVRTGGGDPPVTYEINNRHV